MSDSVIEAVYFEGYRNGWAHGFFAGVCLGAIVGLTLVCHK